MKSIVAIFLILFATQTFADNLYRGFPIAESGDLLKEFESEVSINSAALMSNGISAGMLQALSGTSLEAPITTSIPCALSARTFSDDLSLTLEPTKICHQKNSYGWSDRDEFCNCLASKSFGLLSSDDYRAILEKIVEEAERKQNYYVNTTFQLLKDKVLSSLEATNKYGKEADLSCSPATLISNFTKATKSCSSESLLKIDEMTQQKNVFSLLDENFRELNNEFKSKTYNPKEFQNNQDELAKLLEKVYKHNKGKEIIPSTRISEVDSKIQSLLIQNPLLRKFQVKITYKKQTEARLNYPMNDLIASVEKPDLLEEMTKIQYSNIGKSLFLEDKSNESEFSPHLLDNIDIKKTLKNVVEKEAMLQNQFCKNIQATVKHICDSAISADPTIQSIQKDPLHMSKIVFEVMGDRLYGDEIYKKRYENKESSYGVDIDFVPEVIGFYRPAFASAEKLFEETGSKRMIDTVSALQCTFVSPKHISDFVPGALITKDMNNNIQRFGQIGTLYGEFNSNFLGRIADIDPRLLFNTMKTYDPYALMNSATNWSKDLARAAREENNIETVDKVGFTSKYDWRVHSTTVPIEKAPPLPPISTENEETTISDINKQSERLNQSLSSVREETTEEVESAPVLKIPHVGMTNLPQIGLPTTPQKTTQTSVEVSNKDTTTPEVNNLTDYEMRMQEMMAQMAVLTAKSAQLANQSKGKNEGEEADEEKDELKQTIAGLQAEIDDLVKKKKEVTKVTKVSKQESKPTTIGITPFKSVNQSTPAKSSAQKVTTTNKQLAATSTSRKSTPIASSQSSVSAPSISSPNGSKSFSSQSTSKSGFALNAESVNLEGKFTISAKDFKTSDQKIMSDLYKKANGQPIYVTEKLPDGTEEVVMYEAIKEEDGTIKYVPKKIKDLLSIEKVKQKKTKGKAKKEEKRRKRTKVEDLNKLIDQNKQ